jgi:glutamine cyclotransferase
MTNRHFDLRILGVVLLTAAVLCGCSSRRGTQDAVAAAPFSPPALVAYHAASAVPVLQPQVLARVPHDPTAFTEGLELDHGILYEATGLVGQSQLREVDPATGAVRRAVTLSGQLFGEGITVVRDHIWQLTWQNGVALEWDRATLTLRRELSFTGEGWGLCYDGVRLVRSDGTDRLLFHDPVTFAESGSVAVTLRGMPVTQLNELECVDGQVWANVWQTDQIVRIDPASGQVTAVVDATNLHDPKLRTNPDAVLNGIAAVGKDEFLLTGKLWPVSFLVRFVPMQPGARPGRR